MNACGVFSSYVELVMGTLQIPDQVQWTADHWRGSEWKHGKPSYSSRSVEGPFQRICGGLMHIESGEVFLMTEKQIDELDKSGQGSVYLPRKTVYGEIQYTVPLYATSGAVAGYSPYEVVDTFEIISPRHLYSPLAGKDFYLTEKAWAAFLDTNKASVHTAWA